MASIRLRTCTVYLALKIATYTGKLIKMYYQRPLGDSLELAKMPGSTRILCFSHPLIRCMPGLYVSLFIPMVVCSGSSVYFGLYAASSDIPCGSINIVVT